MNRRRFKQNKHAISTMYDAVFFIVLISLSGVVLIPALHSNIAIESSIEKHREHVADEALNTYLVSRVDKFSYKVAGDIIDDIATDIVGIENTSDGLYASIMNWLLAREQLHKTHANLLAENLGCQFRLPLTLLGTNRFNIFTGDFDRQLKNETIQFLNDYLGDKYLFNLTAWWHPIKGIDFGGELTIGPQPPDQDTHVAHGFIIMPYKPSIDIGGVHIEFTRHWFNNTFFGNNPLIGNITVFDNFSSILSDFINQVPPFDSLDNTSIAVKDNFSSIIDGFLTDGFQNSTGDTVFPGIVNATITYAFNKTKTAILSFTNDTINDFMGEALGSVDRVFAGLNTSLANPLAEGITEVINDTIQDMLQTAFGSVFEAFDSLETSIKENVTVLIHNFIDPYIDMFVDYIFEYIEENILNPASDTVDDIKEQLSIWLADRISINKAEVMLTVWEVRG